MIGALKAAYASFRGFDTTHSAVPPMDGPLRPNAKLDALPVVLTLADVDNLTSVPNGLICSSGAELLWLGQDAPLAITRRQTFAAPIAALASDGEGAIAVGLDSGGVTILGGRHDGRMIDSLNCPTALLFLDRDTLLVANGAAQVPPSRWKHDLMAKGASGSVWRVDLTTGRATQIAGGLGFPTGLALRPGGFFVTEAWRHRIVAMEMGGGKHSIVLADLPAYPARLAQASDGGFWLAMFSPRNPLVEFVLLEDEYRRQMMATIHPDHWIAPNLAPSTSFLQPIQGGARKMLNRLKPWSPSFSYGLACYCDAAMQPRSSLHSRADGGVHGINSLCEAGGTLFLAAKGSGLIVAAPAGERT